MQRSRTSAPPLGQLKLSHSEDEVALAPRDRPADAVGRGEAVAPGVGFAGERELVGFARYFASPVD